MGTLYIILTISYFMFSYNSLTFIFWVLRIYIIEPQGIENVHTANINLQYKFRQSTAEFYNNHILITMLCIFLAEFRLKQRYFA